MLFLRLPPPLTSSLLRLSGHRRLSSALPSGGHRRLSAVSVLPSGGDRRFSGGDKLLHRAKSTLLKLPSNPNPNPLDPKPSLLPNQAVGFVAASQANFMRVIVQAAGPDPQNPNSDARVGTDLLCVVKAVLKKIKRRVLVGDKVVVGAVDWADRRGMIEDVFARASEVSDPPVANVDHLMVVFALAEPKLDAFSLTRFLVEAESSGIELSLVLNKVELVPEATLFDWKERLQNWGYKPLFCSVDKKVGLDTVKEILKGQTTVIMGPSGVGKSSLINALRTVQSEFEPSETEEERMEKLLEQNRKWFGEQRVGTVSKKSGKGKHTTRHVSLLPLADGFLADTPGFSQPSLSKVTKQNLQQFFPEIRRAISQNAPVACSFNDCLHVGEPGCVVAATEEWERYTYYLQLLDEIKIREEFIRRTFGTKQEPQVRYKTGSMGVKQAEPRLNRKKHRRVSRKQLNQSFLDDNDDY